MASIRIRFELFLLLLFFFVRIGEGKKSGIRDILIDTGLARASQFLTIERGKFYLINQLYMALEFSQQSEKKDFKNRR